MKIRQLRAFLAVARTMSFADAAALMHLSQPALSLTIKSLEQSLGGRLLTRTTRTIALTPEGEALLPIAKHLVTQWDNAEEELRQRFSLKLGKIAIAAMPSFAASLLPLGLLHYRQRYPKIKIEVHDVLADVVVEMVRQGRIELGLSFDPGLADDLVCRPLFKDRFVAVLPPKHPLSHLPEIEWPQLLAYDFITLQRPSSVRYLIEAALASQGLQLTVTYDAHQLATVGRMVTTGLGVAAVPFLCQQQMQEQGAVCRPLSHPIIARDVGIITRRRTQLSVAAVAMVEILTDTFGH
jgi:LysR family carnitine catabolism transcriptional activator